MTKKPIAWMGTSQSEMSINTNFLSLPHFLNQLIKYSKNNSVSKTKFDSIVAIASINEQFSEVNNSVLFIPTLLKMRFKFSFFIYTNIFLRFLWKLIETMFFLFLPLNKKFILNVEIESLFYEYIFLILDFKALIISYSFLWGLAPQLAMSKLKKPVILVYYSSPSSIVPLDYNNRFIFYYVKYNPYSHALVWNEKIKNRTLIDDFHHSNCVKTVGPIMFCSPPPKETESYILHKEIHQLISGKIKISIFDLTPFISDAMSGIDNMCIWIYNYNYVKSFIEDILNSCKNIFGEKFVLLMKPKRTPKEGIHDMKYFQFLESIVNENSNNIIMYDPNTNPWHLLGLSNLTISIPYTSTSEASHFLNNPSIYYSPTKIVKSIDEDMLETIYGVDELKNWLEKNKNFKEKTSEEIESYHFKVCSVIEKTACAINKFIEESENKNK